MSEMRRALDRLCIEHLRFMEEADARGDYKRPQRPAPPEKQKTAPSLIYRTHDNNSVSTPAPPAPVSGYSQEVWMEAIGAVISKERQRARKELAPLQTEIEELRGQLAELRGQVTTLLALLHPKEQGKVVDLPALAWRRGA